MVFVVHYGLSSLKSLIVLIIPCKKLNFHLAHITSLFIWVMNALYPSNSNQQCCSTNTPPISLPAGAFKLVKFSIDPCHWQHWGLENWRLLPGCNCTFSYLRLVEAGASEKVDFWSRDSQSNQNLCLLWSLFYTIEEVFNPWFLPRGFWVKSYKLCSDKKTLFCLILHIRVPWEI